MRGSVLAAWRKELGWSQERLACELGIDRQIVDDWELSPNIAPLLELVIASLRTTLAAMRTVQPMRDEFVPRASMPGRITRARRR